MMKQLLLPAFAVALALATPSASSAALSPETVKKMKGKAANVLNVEILDVKQSETSPQGRTSVEYRAKVLSVARSASGVKVGDTITIGVDMIDPTKAKGEENVLKATAELIGPKQPELLKKGWRGKVYLNASTTGKFKIAVFGHSFESE